MMDKTRLEEIYNFILSVLYPDKYSSKKEYLDDSDMRSMEGIKMLIDECGNDREIKLELLDKSEIESSPLKDEYNKFVKFWNGNFIREFMWIGRELTNYNTLGHVAGVHFVAMHVARQLKQAGFPIDLALVSAAAASHDLGKYGCTGKEIQRIPYLHYYYTEELLERNGMHRIARVAGNHSVWDLERDTLSAEWMILIYADFRVKSTRDEHGDEKINFYSLDEAFEVILGKLDNVDAAKAERYKKAYSRLKRFEDYMVYLGVDTELDGEWHETKKTPETARKFMMLDHDLRVASRFNYLDQEKMEKLAGFLACKIAESTGEAARQSRMILREIINNYDPVYNKELPEGAVLQMPEKNAAQLREKYKEIL